MTKADKEGQRKTPILRFKGFTDDWEQRQLRKLAKLITKGTTPQKYDGNINFIKVENIEEVSINPKAKILESEHLGKLKRSILKENDILFSIAGSLGKVGLVNSAILPANTNQALAIIRLSESKDIEYNYIFNYLRSNYIQHFIRRLPSVGAQPNLSLKQINELVIKFPNYCEQQKISNMLDRLNNILTLYERKLKLLSRVKKYFLDNLFAEKEYPNLRFKGFTDEWEQRKLSSLFIKFTDGDWIESKNQSDSGIRLIQTGNIGVSKFINKIGSEKWISEKTLKKLNCTEIFPGDIIISRLPEPTGRACILPEFNTRMITAVDCTIARVSKNVSAEFIVQYLSTQTYFKFIQSRLAGGTRQRISRKNLADFNAFIPVIEEQKDLGLLFNLFDSIIALYENKQQHLTEIKKTLLNTMFI